MANEPRGSGGRATRGFESLGGLDLAGIGSQNISETKRRLKGQAGQRTDALSFLASLAGAGRQATTEEQKRESVFERLIQTLQENLSQERLASEEAVTRESLASEAAVTREGLAADVSIAGQRAAATRAAAGGSRRAAGRDTEVSDQIRREEFAFNLGQSLNEFQQQRNLERLQQEASQEEELSLQDVGSQDVSPLAATLFGQDPGAMSQASQIQLPEQTGGGFNLGRLATGHNPFTGGQQESRPISESFEDVRENVIGGKFEEVRQFYLDQGLSPMDAVNATRLAMFQISGGGLAGLGG